MFNQNLMIIQINIQTNIKDWALRLNMRLSKQYKIL